MSTPTPTRPPCVDDVDIWTLALAEAASFESDEYTHLSLHVHRKRLEASPLWPFLLGTFEIEQESMAQQTFVESRNMALTYLGARLFYAGVTAGRRERGRLTEGGHLALDFPDSRLGPIPPQMGGLL